MEKSIISIRNIDCNQCTNAGVTITLKKIEKFGYKSWPRWKWIGYLVARILGTAQKFTFLPFSFVHSFHFLIYLHCSIFNLWNRSCRSFFRVCAQDWCLFSRFINKCMCFKYPANHGKYPVNCWKFIFVRQWMAFLFANNNEAICF